MSLPAKLVHPKVAASAVAVAVVGAIIQGLAESGVWHPSLGLQASILGAVTALAGYIMPGPDNAEGTQV